MQEWSGAGAVVTGGASGLGAATARALAGIAEFLDRVAPAGARP